MCAISDAVENLRNNLTPQAIRALLHPRYDADGWEPPKPDSAIVQELLREGILMRVDMRSGFERMRDAGVKPTAAGLLVRSVLLLDEAGACAGEEEA